MDCAILARMDQRQDMRQLRLRPISGMTDQEVAVELVEQMAALAQLHRDRRPGRDVLLESEVTERRRRARACRARLGR